MTITLSSEHQLARLESTRAFLDRGTQAARIRIYGGVRAATPADPMPAAPDAGGASFDGFSLALKDDDNRHEP